MVARTRVVYVATRVATNVVTVEGVVLRLSFRLWAIVLLVTFVASCATSPLGRRQIKLYSNHEMERMGSLSFEQIKSDSPRATDRATVVYVECVSTSILAAMDRERPSDWEVIVFENDSANAFALPGRKIGVHTGLLNVAENQDQLAAVIGHEIGHVIAEHSNERVSQSSLAQGGMILAAIVGESSGMTEEQQQMLGLLGVGLHVGVLLPYSRAHESEADLIGLRLMSDAGFDPVQSVALWENMSQGGGQPPELLSTHPSPATRIRELKQHIPENQRLYEEARTRGVIPRCGA